MKALSLWQPWASLLAWRAADGGRVKQYETRHWPTRYRGLLAIHATKRAGSPEAVSLIMKAMLADGWRPVDVMVGLGRTLPRGAVIAVGELTDCVQMTPALIAEQSDLERAVGAWAPGRWAWKIGNVVSFDPIPAKGFQRIWNWDVPAHVERIHGAAA